MIFLVVLVFFGSLVVRVELMVVDVMVLEFELLLVDREFDLYVDSEIVMLVLKMVIVVM